MQDTISTLNTPNRKPRRTYTKEFKRQVVSQCDRGDKSIAQVALEHEINANLVHKWSRQFKSPNDQRMVPVTLSSTGAVSASSSRIEVSVGSATIRFYGHVDRDSASAVLSALQ